MALNNERFTTVNISDCLDNKIEGFGEADLDRAVSAFSSIDGRVESFLKDSAKDFARQHKSVTYLVFSSDMAKLLGYFAMTIKSITARAEKMSKTTERAFKKAGKFDEEMGTYTAGAYLIAQLGRNFSPSLKSNISGDALLYGAMHILKKIQRDIGGLIVFLEAQDNNKVLSFYRSYGFRDFDRRMASGKGGENCELVQLVKIL